MTDLQCAHVLYLLSYKYIELLDKANALMY